MNSWGSKTRGKFSGNPTNLTDGEWYSLDNRRLYAFQQAGMTDIPIEDVSNQVNLIRGQRWKFSTENGGSSIELLGGSGC